MMLDSFVDKFKKNHILSLPEPTGMVDGTLPLLAVRLSLKGSLDSIDLFNEGVKFYNDEISIDYYSEWFHSNIYKIDIDTDNWGMFAYNISNDSLYLLENIPKEFQKPSLDFMKLLANLDLFYWDFSFFIKDINENLIPKHVQIGEIVIELDGNLDTTGPFSPQNVLKLVKMNMPQMMSNKVFSVQPMSPPSNSIAYVQPTCHS